MYSNFDPSLVKTTGSTFERTTEQEMTNQIAFLFISDSSMGVCMIVSCRKKCSSFLHPAYLRKNRNKCHQKRSKVLSLLLRQRCEDGSGELVDPRNLQLSLFFLFLRITKLTTASQTSGFFLSFQVILDGENKIKNKKVNGGKKQ